MLHSYERREDFAEIAQQNVERYFGSPHPAWQLTIGDLQDNLTETDVDRVVLDMLAPWECLDVVSKALVPGGILCAYVATTTQLSRTVESIREIGCFAEPQPWESMIRNWHVEGLAVRPDHRMIGHTGFLVTARRLRPTESSRRRAAAAPPRAPTAMTTRARAARAAPRPATETARRSEPGCAFGAHPDVPAPPPGSRTDPGTRRRRLFVAHECALNAGRDPWRPHRSTAV